MVNGRIIDFSGSRLEVCSLQKCMSSLAQSSARVPGHWIQSMLEKMGIQSVQILHMLEEFMSETDAPTRDFSDRTISASMFNDVSNWEMSNLNE